MKKPQAVIIAVLVCAVSFFGQQKGIDSQTQKVTENKTVRSGNEVSRSINFGKGKTRTRERLANPYRMVSKRDVLIETITDVLESRKLLVDDAASRPKDGIVVSQPFIFAKGAVITRTELNRYAILPGGDLSWTRARFTLTIEVQSIDGNQNNVSVTAKVEGKTEGVLGSEWNTLPSSGEAEDVFMAALVEAVTGISVDEPSDQ